MVTIDANHPLAGKNLNFDVEITDVRDATEKSSRTARARRGWPPNIELRIRSWQGLRRSP